MDKYKSQFPANFFWGASTSSHQVEGNNHNQWSVWELEHAKVLAQFAHERYGDLAGWEDIKDRAQQPANYVSGAGVNHYKKFKEDFALAKKIQLNALRFGIEWARLEPSQGQWDQEAIDHYRDYIKELRKKGLEPFINIWHWTLPVWFAEQGGFTKRANLKYFERFVEKIAMEFGDELSYVLTINEPNVYASHSYGLGWWPPQEKNWFKVAWVMYNLASAHRRAYRIFKRHKPSLHIGIATQLANIQAKRPHNYIDQAVTKIMRYVFNWWFINRVRRYQDFVGFNYYFTDYYKGLHKESPKVPVSDLGWYMEPEGLYPLLVRTWARYRKPIIVTENGVADEQDQYRQWWLEETIIAMERALSEGVQVVGYFHWSLLDNFEWSEGWWPKFGLVKVDRKQNMKRELRPSAHWLAKKINQINKTR